MESVKALLTAGAGRNAAASGSRLRVVSTRAGLSWNGRDVAWAKHGTVHHMSPQEVARLLPLCAL